MKEKLYEHYVSTHFGNIHRDMEKELELYYRYFCKNYSCHMPADRAAYILDIGCGMGHFLYFMRKEGYGNYLGIDVSPENIDFCRKNGFRAEQYDVFQFFADNTGPFDAIVANDFIEHFKKEEIVRILELVNKSLAPGGKLIIKVPNAANPIVGSSSRYYDFTHEVSFTEESLSQVLRIYGFKDVRVYPQDLYVLYGNPLNYPAKAAAWLSFKLYRLLFVLYGRKTTRIFTKDLIAVAQKR